MKDPITIIQKILDKVFGHLLYYIEQEFFTRFGRMSPSVSGVTETVERLKGIRTGDWGTMAQFDADFTNMYSLCDVELLKRHVLNGARLAGLSEDSVAYIFNLIEVNMAHSYFREPTGIFHTTTGYSMGDNSASKGSEVILRDSELGTFQRLQDKSLLKNVEDYFRFKDDIHAHPDGTIDEVLEALHIISTSYPQEIQLNVEINIVQGKFLNLRLYNLIGSEGLFTTILRKRNSKYDVIPFDSNTQECYKYCAGRTYFDLTRSHCTDLQEQKRQVGVVKHILRLKKYSERQITNMSRKRRMKPLREKLYAGKIEHDNVSRIHKYLREICSNSDLDLTTFALPMAVPGKKILQYVFTLRKLRQKLNF